MTLKEAFEAMRLEHRPKMEMSESGIWWCLVGSDFVICPKSLAESAICWAMLKAIAENNRCHIDKTGQAWFVSARDEVWQIHPDALTALAAVYASEFPKEKA